MRINTNDGNDYRTDLYERTAERFGVGTKSSGIDAACEFSTQILRNLERAAEHDDMTEDLAELLSTANAPSNIVSSLVSRSTADRGLAASYILPVRRSRGP